MGASQEKKRRREEREIGIEKRLVQNKNAEEERKKKKRIAYIVSAVLIVFVLVVVFFSIPQMYSGFEAVEVGGKSFSVAEYNYHYFTTYLNYYQQAYATYGEYYSYAMPDELSLREEVLSTLCSTVAFAEEGEQNGYELSEEQKKVCEDLIAQTKSDAENAGYSSFKKYLKNAYGSTMTEKVFEEQTWYSYYASEYSKSTKASYEYSETELSEYYEENKDSLDVFTYRSFKIDGKAVEDDPDTEVDESVDAETAMANAKKTAEEFMAAVKTEEDFIKMAYEYASEDDKETYEDDDATLYNVQKGSMNTYYLDWLLEENREEGDIDIFEGSNAYYITYFIKRDSNDYETVNIRTIFIGIDSVNKDDYELNAEYEEAVEDEIEEAEEQAEDILNEFVGGIADSETFANLSDKYDEQYTREDGGLVENVSHNQYAEIINTWLFDKDRKSEDVEMFFIEDEGYYIIFFEEKAERYCDYLADNELRNEEYDAWREEIEADVTYDTKFWFKFVA